MIETILFAILVLDMVIYNVIAWFEGDWYKRNFRLVSRQLPVTKAFGVFYFVLVFWLGYALVRLGVLGI